MFPFFPICQFAKLIQVRCKFKNISRSHLISTPAAKLDSNEFCGYGLITKKPLFGEATDFTMDVPLFLSPVSFWGLLTQKYIAKQDNPNNETNMWYPYTV